MEKYLTIPVYWDYNVYRECSRTAHRKKDGQDCKRGIKKLSF